MMKTINNDPKHKITVARVDCTQNGDLCNDEKVQGYPTLKFYRAEDKTGVEYEGPRNALSFVEFLNKQLDAEIDSVAVQSAEKEILLESKTVPGEEEEGADEEVDDVVGLNDEVVIPDAVNGLFELTDENAEGFLASGRHFVKFYAPW